jgi:hypothetical protein
VTLLQSIGKRQSHTGSFLQVEECNRLKFLISNQTYNTSMVADLLTASTNLNLTETIQGINQNTFYRKFSI